MIINSNVMYTTAYGQDGGIVYGKFGHSTATDNSVIINAGTVRFGLYGGRASSKPGTTTVTATGNSVTMNGGTVGSDLYGGNAHSFSDTATATATSNSVTMSDGIVGQTIHGGSAYSFGGATSTGNSLTMSGGAVHGSIYGGDASSFSSTTTATGNSVTMSGGTVSWDIYGGMANSFYGTATSTATGNSVTMSGGTVGRYIYGGMVFSNGGTATANENSVTMSGGTVSWDIYGGGAESSTRTATAIASNNQITVSGNSNVSRDIFGGLLWSTNETPSSVTATDNNITISSNAVAANKVYGGFYKEDVGGVLVRGNAPGDLFTGNTLNKNSVCSINEVGNFEFVNFGYSGNANINYLDTTPTGSERPGVVVNTAAHDIMFDGIIAGSGSMTKAGTGTLTLSGANTYTGLTRIRSGTLALGSDLTSSSGLVLHSGTSFNTGGFRHSLANKELTVFDSATYTGDMQAQGATLNFITAGVPTGSMLSVSGKADITGANVNLGLPGDARLAPGTNLSLLKAAHGLIADASIVKGNGAGILREGATIVHDVAFSTTPDELLATIVESGASKSSKALSEGFLGGMLLTQQGADMAAGQGMDAAMRAVHSDTQGTDSGWTAFGAVGGNLMRYNTGSHVDMRSLSLMAGLAHGVELSGAVPGRLTLGAFFEYGNGSYNTYNSLNTASLEGDGNSHYTGGGILGRMDFADTGPGHFYTEASARMGGLYNKYENDDLRDINGRAVAFDSASVYYGVHVGTGYLWNITGKASLDMYGKYFWSRQLGDSVSLSTGEDVDFNAINSHRVRLGTRYSYSTHEYITPYIGAAWEYEFDGRAGATTNGHSIETPSLMGHSGIGELGLVIKPSPTVPLSFDLGVQSYVGKREGVTGNVQVRFEF